MNTGQRTKREEAPEAVQDKRPGHQATRQRSTAVRCRESEALSTQHSAPISQSSVLSPQSSVFRSTAVLLIGVTLLAGTGCGYSTRRPFPEGIRTVHVKTFHSKEFRRDLEFQLTEALVKRVNLDTPYKIADLRSADTVLSGEILEVRNRTIGDDFETQLPRETASTIIVAYRWKDLRSGRILAERERFLYTTTYIPPVGETFATGMVRGMDGLAEAIVESMESPW